ncbi:serine/threonine-protein kinase CTR1-like [Planoprotostelium fungivorum]|uniref:Serine/threonine-protein kinase CTR1-like n=1 Tax=Planoprotostelium fungivorum TaxID=1890364 RepID=A0A2P6N722_9EUKA|nr:serine/threonine-protein kinase CTR1-like [Planoprotostelium fungivorum]
MTNWHMAHKRRKTSPILLYNAGHLTVALLLLEEQERRTTRAEQKHHKQGGRMWKLYLLVCSLSIVYAVTTVDVPPGDLVQPILSHISQPGDFLFQLTAGEYTLDGNLTYTASTPNSIVIQGAGDSTVITVLSPGMLNGLSLIVLRQFTLSHTNTTTVDCGLNFQENNLIIDRVNFTGAHSCSIGQVCHTMNTPCVVQGNDIYANSSTLNVYRGEIYTDYYVNVTLTRCHWTGNGSFLVSTSAGDITLSNSTFSSQYAIQSVISIRCGFGRMSLYNLVFSNIYGSAIWIQGGSTFPLSVLVQNNTFDAVNSADFKWSNPSVIYINYLVADRVDIIDCSFTNNARLTDPYIRYSGIFFIRGSAQHFNVDGGTFFNNTSPHSGTDYAPNYPTIASIHYSRLNFTQNSANAIYQINPFGSFTAEDIDVYTDDQLPAGWAFNMTLGYTNDTKNVILRRVRTAGGTSDSMVLSGLYGNVLLDQVTGIGNNGGRLFYSPATMTSFTVTNSTAGNYVSTGDGGFISLSGVCPFISIRHLTINNTSSASRGGAIFLSSSTPTHFSIEGITVYNSTAQTGGAMAIVSQVGSSFTLSDVSILAASAKSSGGGIYVSGFGDEVVMQNVRVVSSSASYGAGIYIEGSWTNVSVLESVFSGGSATEGGALLIATASEIVQLGGITIDSCSAQQMGGAVSFSGDTDGWIGISFFSQGRYVCMNNTTIDSCASLRGDDTEGEGYSTESTGAAVYINAGATTNVTVTNSVFSNGQSDDSGSIYINSAGSLNIFQSVISNNTANSNGGSIYAVGTSYILLSDTQLNGNMAGSYGGSVDIISKSGGMTVDVIRCVFSENKGQTGGAIYATDSLVVYGKMNLINCTITNNEAGYSGGALYFDTNNGTVYSEGTMWTNNTASQHGAIFYRSASGRSSVIFRSSVIDSNAASITGGIYLAGNMSRLELRDTRLSNNYGATGGALYVSEIPNMSVFYNCTFYGNRATITGGAIDMSSSGGTASVYMYKSVCEKNSAENGGCVYGVGVKQMYIAESNVSHNAGGAMRYGGGLNVLRAVNSSFINNTCSDSGSVFQLTSISSITLLSSLFSLNQAGKQGGAVYISEGAFTSISDSQFINNSAATGGAVYLSGGKTNITNTQCKGNRAQTNGGGLYINAVTSGKRQQTETRINGSELTENTAQNGGGAYIVSTASAVLVDSTSFTKNSAEYGGGIGLNGSVTLSNSQWNGNDAQYGTAIAAFSSGTLIQLNGQTTWLADGISLQLIGVSSVVCDTGSARAQGNQYTCEKQTTSGSGLGAGIIIAIVAASAAVVVIIAIIVTVVVIKRHNMRNRQKHFSFDLSSLDLGNAKKVVIDYNDIRGLVEIGQGGFGVVYSGEWRGAKVAIKQLLSQTVSREQLESFIQEVSLLQSLRSHPNLVMFIGTTIPPDPLSLVTEFCECGSLDGYLQKNPDTPFDVLSKFVIDIARGMLHLHRENIIHRDLAARNILLNSSLVAKVSDFGLSREVSNEEGNKTQSSVGPLKWMSPEALLQREYSSKSDVYSFGITTWEKQIMFKSEPYPGITALQSALNVSNEDMRPIIPEKFDVAMTKLMRKCWSKSPEDRPSFAQIVAWLTGRIGHLEQEIPQSNNSQQVDSHSSLPIPREPNESNGETNYGVLGLPQNLE